MNKLCQLLANLTCQHRIRSYRNAMPQGSPRPAWPHLRPHRTLKSVLRLRKYTCTGMIIDVHRKQNISTTESEEKFHAVMRSICLVCDCLQPQMQQSALSFGPPKSGPPKSSATFVFMSLRRLSASSWRGSHGIWVETGGRLETNFRTENKWSVKLRICGEKNITHYNSLQFQKKNLYCIIYMYKFECSVSLQYQPRSLFHHYLTAKSAHISLTISLAASVFLRGFRLTASYEGLISFGLGLDK